MNKHHAKMIGKKFGKLTVLSHHSRQGGYNCVCDCGNITNARAYMLTHGLHNSCGCVAFVKGEDNKHYKGYEGFSASHYYHIKYRAKRRKLEFNVSLDYLWNLYLTQKRKCVYTGWDIEFRSYRLKENTTASLDRIDSSKGYIEGNVQWIHKDINPMKWSHSHEYFIKLCKIICDNCIVQNIASA